MGGKFLSPKGAKSDAIVLIVPGSGPTDCDGNSPLGIKANSYKLLAEALAKNSISSLRIDKRGMHGSAKAIRNANAVTIDNYAEDVCQWLRMLKAQFPQTPLVLLGHSEGGLVALATNDQLYDAIILAASPGRPLNLILKEQLATGLEDQKLNAIAGEIISKLENGKLVETSEIPKELTALFNPEIQPFLISLFSYNPIALARKISKPMLILQGKNDIQVSDQDAQLLRDNATNAQLTLLPDVNHVLKRITSKNRSDNIRSYSDPIQPISSAVVYTVVGFIRSIGSELK